jgi:methyl-accepting chemotaxis protein
VQGIKRAQIEGFFAERYADASVLSANREVIEATRAFTRAFAADGGRARGDRWAQVARSREPWLSRYRDEYGYYDLFLISDEGDVVYSVAGESDLGQNLKHGDLSDSALARCFERALSGPAIADFRPYAPSGGEHAAFIGAPVVDGDEVLGVVALQIPTDPINAIVQRRDGMGETGETYLVGRLEDRTAFRSDMTTMGDGRYVIGYPITTPYIEQALDGEQAHDVFTDSAGRLVMVSYAPLDVAGLEWACVSKIDLEEAIVPQLGGGSGDFFARYIDEYGYYDLFLIDPGGQAFYTVCREADYGTNLVDGEFASSNLGELTRRVLGEKTYGMVDFAPYAPSNGDPAAFIAQPVIEHGEVTMVVALQLSLDAINAIMQEREGMGETGETYLVGEDLRMRSDSYLDPEGHSVLASFAGSIAENGVDTEAAREALAGQSDARVITDYNGNPVLSAYAPVDLGGITWALLAEIDQSEAFAAVRAMTWLTLVTAAIGIVAIVVVALLVASSIARPLNRIISGLSAGSDQTRDAAGAVSSASQSLASGTSEQAAAIEETASSMEEMTAMTRRNASNAAEANAMMSETSEVVGRGQNSIAELSTAIDSIKHSSDETAKIIGTINEIAFQTNLLALNAAVEAARAGDAGQGFAVVAEEVRNLAARSAEAATNTAQLIAGAVENAENGVRVAGETTEVFQLIAGQAEKVASLVNEIASASGEQAQGIDQVNTAVSQVDTVTQGNAASAEESASAAEELASQAEDLNRMVSELRVLVEGGVAAATAAWTNPTPAGPTAPVVATRREFADVASGQEKSEDVAEPVA